MLCLRLFQMRNGAIMTYDMRSVSIFLKLIKLTFHITSTPFNQQGDVSNKRNTIHNIVDLTKERATKRAKPNPQCLAARSNSSNSPVDENFSHKRTRTLNDTGTILTRTNFPSQPKDKKRRISEDSVPYDESFSISTSEGDRDPTEDDIHAREERQEIETQTYFAVPQDYRLHRTTYARDLCKCSLAPLDSKNSEDVLMASDYVTDMFQYLYQREVSAVFYYAKENLKLIQTFCIESDRNSSDYLHV